MSIVLFNLMCVLFAILQEWVGVPKPFIWGFVGFMIIVDMLVVLNLRSVQ